MLEMIGAWFAKSALMMSPVGGLIRGAGALIKKIPWQVWAAIGIALALWLGVRWHAHQMHERDKAHFDAGYAKAVADIKAAEAKKIAPLKEAKAVGDTQNIAVNEEVKKTYDTQNAHIDRNVADLLSLWQTGSAGGSGAQSGSGLPGVAGSAGAQPAGSPADDGLAQVPFDPAAAGQLVAVPAQELAARAGQCDRDYTALKAWEGAYAGWRKTYDEWLTKTDKIAQPSR